MQNPDHDPIFQKGSQIPISIQKKDRDPDFAIFDRDPTQPLSFDSSEGGGARASFFVM